MITPIFRSAELQEDFERDGYVVARELIPPTVVQQLRALYLEYAKEHHGDKLGMHSTAHINKFEILRHIHQRLQDMTSEYADKFLINYKFYLGNFLIKESREDSLFDLHQDWTCVDEPEYCSLNFWMDLEGMNQNNGRLFVLKGTHRLAPNIRYAPQCRTPWSKVKRVAPLFYTYLDTNPGDVVFLNNATLHGSVVNRSGKNRIAAVMGAYSSSAALLHYYKDPASTDNKIERYRVSTESFINMPRGERPPGAIFDGYVPCNTRDVEPDEFIRFMMQRAGMKEKAHYYGQKFKGWFNYKISTPIPAHR